ncbi:type 2 isopentenyl-diphosphate Delta-isomerase [Syntrophomonas palmitatica]|uniref:type 2 isopentenyl-diphosphate Delta-isomerase n=1 Tax=Syntrophomonas palmitatica TaxID=402877 RepID=UPI0006D10A91|nr:type 2 isopentenyl-diphosphate Delta-isomerase [Syntrophomonas palmitatica]
MRDQRKTDHIHIAVKTPDGPCSNGLQDMFLINQSVPELDLEDIDLTCDFLGKNLEYPLIINAITGGNEQAYRINQGLSLLAAKYGLAMAVGSQTIAIRDPGLRDSFRVVRDNNPEGIIMANVSANSTVEEALAAVDMIDADGLQLHFNIPQELAMTEGDRRFRGLLENVQNIASACRVPVIAKEVGFGFSRESVFILSGAGIKTFDIGGSGGSNFIAIEAQRGGNFSDVNEWGIPTAISLGETVSTGLDLQVIASGGIRTALETAKCIAMGADLVGMAGTLLKILLQNGLHSLDEWLDKFLFKLKAILLMTGSKNIDELQKCPLIITGNTAAWLKARGIDVSKWSLR